MQCVHLSVFTHEKCMWHNVFSSLDQATRCCPALLMTFNLDSRGSAAAGIGRLLLTLPWLGSVSPGDPKGLGSTCHSHAWSRVASEDRTQSRSALALSSNLVLLITPRDPARAHPHRLGLPLHRLLTLGQCNTSSLPASERSPTPFLLGPTASSLQ